MAVLPSGGGGACGEVRFWCGVVWCDVSGDGGMLFSLSDYSSLSTCLSSYLFYLLTCISINQSTCIFFM